MSRDDVRLQASILRTQLEIPPDESVGIEYLKLAQILNVAINVEKCEEK